MQLSWVRLLLCREDERRAVRTPHRLIVRLPQLRRAALEDDVVVGKEHQRIVGIATPLQVLQGQHELTAEIVGPRLALSGGPCGIIPPQHGRREAVEERRLKIVAEELVGTIRDQEEEHATNKRRAVRKPCAAAAASTAVASTAVASTAASCAAAATPARLPLALALPLLRLLVCFGGGEQSRPLLRLRRRRRPLHILFAVEPCPSCPEQMRLHTSTVADRLSMRRQHDVARGLRVVLPAHLTPSHAALPRCLRRGRRVATRREAASPRRLPLLPVFDQSVSAHRLEKHLGAGCAR